MQNLMNLNVKLFADGADLAGMLEMYSKSYIQGLTTNPTLMKKAGTDCQPIDRSWVLKIEACRTLAFRICMNCRRGC